MLLKYIHHVHHMHSTTHRLYANPPWHKTDSLTNSFRLMPHLSHGCDDVANSGKVGRCRFTPGRPQADPACFHRLKLTYDKLLSNVGFNCNVHHYSAVKDGCFASNDLRFLTFEVGAVQVDPRWCKLTPG